MGLFVEAQPKDRLYHYTNDDGLRGILKSGQLWLTNIFKLNDPSEVSHGFDIGVKALTSSRADGTPQSKEFARVLEAFYNRVGIQGSAKFFVCSFSWHEDDLCQWRAYADNGRGYALEFDAAALDAVVKSEAHTEAFPITYADAGLDKLDCDIIDAYRRMIDIDQIMQSAPSNDDAGELYTGLIVQLLRASLFLNTQPMRTRMNICSRTHTWLANRSWEYTKNWIGGASAQGTKKDYRRSSGGP